MNVTIAPPSCGAPRLDAEDHIGADIGDNPRCLRERRLPDLQRVKMRALGGQEA
jgi:hypothetical protein